MPAHDWTRVDAGLFHAFHQRWIAALCDAFNDGGLPPGFFALAEQSIRGPIPDVLALHVPDRDLDPTGPPGPALALAEAPPRARLVQRAEAGALARKSNRVAVHHRHGRVVAVIEIVSPGNKAAGSELRGFVNKVSSLIRQGIHVLVVDLFPPSVRDPSGLHKVIWDEFESQDFTLPPDQPLTVASYAAGPVVTAYVEPFAVADQLPAMPLFLDVENYVPTPLEATYQTSWDVFPAPLKRLLEPMD